MDFVDSAVAIAPSNGSSLSSICIVPFCIGECSNKQIQGRLTIMKKSCIIWLLEKNAELSFGSLVASIPTKFEPMSLSTTLISSTDDATNQCTNISKKLSTLFKIEVFVSTEGYSEFDNNMNNGGNVTSQLLLQGLIDILSKHYKR